MPMSPLFVNLALALSGIVFALSAVGKFQYARDFRAALAAYRLLPPALVTPVALLLGLAEALVALALCAVVLVPALDFLQPAAALGGIVLYLLFSGAVAVNLVRGRTDIDCGCFFQHQTGALSRSTTIGTGLLIRNATLAAGLLLVFMPDAAPALWCERIGAGLGAMIIILLHASLQLLLSLARYSREGHF
jgi:hypothetical protein